MKMKKYYWYMNNINDPVVKSKIPNCFFHTIKAKSLFEAKKAVRELLFCKRIAQEHLTGGNKP